MKIDLGSILGAFYLVFEVWRRGCGSQGYAEV